MLISEKQLEEYLGFASMSNKSLKVKVSSMSDKRIKMGFYKIGEKQLTKLADNTNISGTCRQPRQTIQLKYYNSQRSRFPVSHRLV